MVLGAGAFGTALAAVFARGGLDVILWGRDDAAVQAMQSTHQNARYLPDVGLPDALGFSRDLGVAKTADLVLIAVPAQQTRDFVAGLTTDAPTLVVAKGIEVETGDLPHQVAGAAAVVSGPGFATELAVGKPTALSSAAPMRKG